jgi:hypothetical protein
MEPLKDSNREAYTVNVETSSDIMGDNSITPSGIKIA